MNESDLLMEKTLKIVIIGNSGVGKSSILLAHELRAENNNVNHDSDIFYKLQSTVGIDFAKIKKIVNGKEMNVMVFDTAGQERFRAIATSIYHNSDGFIIVYDITDKNSFEDVKIWIDSINSKCDVENVNILLIGNKIDLEHNRQISYSEGEKLAQSHNMLFAETSAINLENIVESFQQFVEKIITHSKKKDKIYEQKKILSEKKLSHKDEQNIKEPKGSCC